MQSESMSCILHGGAHRLGLQQLTVHIKCGHSIIFAKDCRGAITLHKLGLNNALFLTRPMLYATSDMGMQVAGPASVRGQVARKSLQDLLQCQRRPVVTPGEHPSQ